MNSYGSGKKSGLIAGPAGSVEFKNFTGKEKGVQVASGAGLCLPAALFFVSVFYFTWFSIHGVSFRYTSLSRKSN